MKLSRATVLASSAMFAIVLGSVMWGRRVQTDERVKLGAAPLVGAWKWRPGLGTLLPIAVGVLALVTLPRIAARARFALAAASTAVAAVAFTLALAAADGWSHVLDPVVHPSEYWANLVTLPPAGDMLRHYGTIDFLLKYSVHAKGHPPAFLLLLKMLSAVGLGHPWVAGALSYLGVAVLPVAVLLTVRSVASENAARTTAPFLALAPYAVWMGTSADALYTAVAASGVACFALALHTASRLNRWILAFSAGLLLSLGLFFTYGLVPFLLLPVIITVAMQPSRRVVSETAAFAVVAAALVTFGFRAAGFWWFDGVRTTRTFYWWGTAQYRPWRYFLVGNLGSSLIAVGPVVVLGLAALRQRAIWWIVGGGLFCLLVADVSQYSKGEVERIWLLFFPWLIPAVVALPKRRAFLAAHASSAVLLQTWLVSKW
jgi:methylthioxylose transferase